MKNGATLLIVLMLFSCRHAGSPSKQQLSEERFQLLYIALLEHGERTRSLLPDSTKRSQSDSIFRAYGTSEQEFRSALSGLGTDPRNWQGFYDAVTQKLEEEQKKKTKKQNL